MTNPDYRALCAELLRAMDEIEECEVVDWGYVKTQPLKMASQSMAEARALLAQPVAEGPTDDELLDLWLDGMDTSYARGSLTFARAVLAKWGCHD